MSAAATNTSSTTEASSSSELLSSVSSFSSLLPTVHAEDEGNGDESDDGEVNEESVEEAADSEEEEGEEIEDPMPSIYESCESSKDCAPIKHHFDECQNRVQEGQGFKGEDCMEEFPSGTLCERSPKIFTKLV